MIAKLEHLVISIHAPVKGATFAGLFVLQQDYISIHAPVKGATKGKKASKQVKGDFNPRPREGSDNY